MIDIQATFKIMAYAKERAEAPEGGGLAKKLNDFKSYGQTAGASALSFAVSHIPVLGPSLAAVADLAVSYGISKLYQKFTIESVTDKEKVTNTLFLLERSLATSMRQAYNTANDCSDKPPRHSTNCQDAHQEAYAVALLNESINELEASHKFLMTLSDSLTAEVSRLRAIARQKELKVRNNIDDLEELHKEEKCGGLNKCYWIKGIPSPFDSIRDNKL